MPFVHYVEGSIMGWIAHYVEEYDDILRVKALERFPYTLKYWIVMEWVNPYYDIERIWGKRVALELAIEAEQELLEKLYIQGE
jgi:hypothetical protein